MKITNLLLLIPMSLMLCSCSQEVKLGNQDTGLVKQTVTQSAEVVYPDDLPSVPDGKPVYDKMNCAKCHGTDGGTSVKASAETLKGFGANSGSAQSLASIKLNDKVFMAKRTPLEQYVLLSQGSATHPFSLRDKLSRRQIWDLVFYSRSLAVPLLSDEEWGKIDPVFGSNCAVCHGKRGHGDGPLAKNMEPIPANFHSYNRFYKRTDDQIWDHIAYGIKWEGMPNFLGKQDSKKNVKFDKDYIRKLVQYVRAFGESNLLTAGKNIADSTQAHGVGQ